ncbi:MAG: sulfatase [Anaerolineae bacterium]|nr:sulfatase [Anaerolineae bacterium]
MNLIVICIDSLRQDHVSFYNPASPVKTPNIDRFARRSVSVTNVYPEALPTIPIRTQLMTGQRTLTSRPWQPLTKEDRTLAEILNLYDYTSAFITDVYHYFWHGARTAPGYNFHRGFNVYRWIRGQEYDPYRSGPLKRLRVEDHTNEKMPSRWEWFVRRALQNIEPFAKADDHYCARVVAEACEWLEENRSYERIFLWVDSFDPHEPWTPPKEFDHYTDPNYKGKRYILPPGGLAANYFTPAEIAFIRGLYAGEVAYVDHYIGKLLAAVESWGLYDNSVILLMADHGHPLADHGKFLKGTDRMYNELLKVPCLIHFPGDQWGGRTLDALGLFHDIPVTLLDALGYGGDADAFQGRSLMPVIRGEANSIRETIITGYHQGKDRCIRDKRWSYVSRPENEPDELYDLLADPQERNNLIDTYPEEAKRLASGYGRMFAMKGQPIKGLQGRYEVGESP